MPIGEKESRYTMIVKRYGFETNSSSMHSLCVRSESGSYKPDEIYSEELNKFPCYDAILTLNQYDPANINYYQDRVYNNRLYFWQSDFDFQETAMEILTTFYDKIRYAMASVCSYSYKGADAHWAEIEKTIEDILPNVEYETPQCFNKTNEWEYDGFRKRVNHNLLLPFLRQNQISMREFLINPKYVVVVNYSEFIKMKYLNMIDENSIESVFIRKKIQVDSPKPDITLKNGVWMLDADDLCFGRYPFRVLGTPEGKARYAIASNYDRDDILEIMQEIYPNMTGIHIKNNAWSTTPYCEDCAIPRDIPIRDFILDKRYVIISDGDEYCVFNEFANTLMFNKAGYVHTNNDEECDE